MKKYIILLLILLLPFNVLAYSDKIIPGGDTLGIEVKNKGVIIVGFYRVKSKLNKNNLLWKFQTIIRNKKWNIIKRFIINIS